MINHSLKDGTIYISIENMDFSYRIPQDKIGSTIDWKIGAKGTMGIVIPEVSKWTLQLFSKKPIEDKYVKLFKGIVQEYAPTNEIDWKETQLALNIQNEYNSLIAPTNATDKKNSEDEIITLLKKKFKLN